jgi:DNA topoisomerase-3
MTLLRGLGIEELTAPELTGEWEHRLALMEHGELQRDTFMQDIAQMTRHMVERAKSYESDTVPGDYATLKTPCPKCGGTVQENYRRFACVKCDFSLPKHPGSRTFETEEVEQLLEQKVIGPLTGFRSKMGRPFSAALKISPEFKLEFDFGNAAAGDDGAEVDFSGLTPLGPCPKCGGQVYEQAMAYICEKSVGAARSCDFRSGRVILQQPIEAEQMRKLLAEGRTDLLRGFVSNRTRRKFAAFLVRKPDGSTGFEFEARPARAPSAAGETPASARKAVSKAPVEATPAAPAATRSRVVGKTPSKAAGKSAAKAAPVASAAKSGAASAAASRKSVRVLDEAPSARTVPARAPARRGPALAVTPPARRGTAAKAGTGGTRRKTPV